jgi:endoglucanase
MKRDAMNGMSRINSLRLACGVLVAVGIWTLAAGSTPAAAPESAVPPARLAALARGVNLGHWFSVAPYQHPRLTNWIAASEFSALASAGFGHVRLPVELEMYLDEEHPASLRPDYLADLDVALDHILTSGLAVVVDFHARPKTKQRLLQDDVLAGKFACVWGALARNLAGRNPNKVFLEAMNAPSDEMPLARWLEIQGRFLAAIRAEAPRQTVIVSANRGNTIEGLIAMQPLADQNVVYTFHFYDPLFTWQGATWSQGPERWVAGLAYPADAANKATVADKVADPKIRGRVMTYDSNRESLAARIEAAAQWARRYRVPLFCGEFGVDAKLAPPDSRLRWINDVRQSCEERGIGWAMWNYCDEYPVALGNTPGQRELVPACLRALGLPEQTH